MPVSPEFCEQHMVRWRDKLAKSRAPYRKFWPTYLFRHERIENAARIIRAGSLLSRRDARGFVDIAAQDVLARVPAAQIAQAMVRLYFRPNTPTQFHVEGVKRIAEYYHGVHAPVLVMLIFDARRLLTRAGTQFSNGNMQSPQVALGDDEEFFGTQICFDDVYHCFGFSPDDRDRIVRTRCAEVLTPSPLPLANNLSAIVCRSSAERTYMLDLLGDAAGEELNRKIVAYSEPGIFVAKWAFVDSVELSETGARIKFHPREDGGLCSFRVDVYAGRKRTFFAEQNDADLSKVWLVKHHVPNGRYRCVISIEGSTAYDANHLVDNLPF